MKIGREVGQSDCGEFVIDSTWVFAVFGCLAAAALVASQVVRKRDLRRRRAESETLVRRPRPFRDLGDEGPSPDVPPQREVVEERDRQRSRDA